MSDDYFVTVPAAPPPPQLPPPPAYPPPGLGYGGPGYGAPPPPPPAAFGEPPLHARSYYPPLGRMGFGDSVRAGWQLITTSWGVLRDDLWLLAVPVVTLLIGALATWVYLVAVHVGTLADQGGRHLTLVALPLAAFLTVLGTLGNAVVVVAATTRLEGGRASLGLAWAKVLTRLPQLTGWALILVAERTLTGLLRSGRGRGLGDLAANLLDRAWDFVTFLAVPVLVYERVGPIGAVRRSGELVRRRWGAELTAKGVIGIASFVVVLPLALLAVLVAVEVSVVVGAIALGLILVTAVAVTSAMTGIVSAAMYRFAVTGLVAPGFREEDMWAAFSRPR